MIDTKELRKICEAAQPYSGSPKDWFWIGETMASQYTPSVASYFEAAIKNLPALVDELDAARAELERMKKKLHVECSGCPGCGSNDCPDALDIALCDVERLKAQLADCDPEDMPHPVSLRGAWNAMRQDREELKRLRGLVREFAEAKDEYVRFSNVGFSNVGSDRLVASGDALYAAGKEIAK
jgi:hypothetical protein